MKAQAGASQMPKTIRPSARMAAVWRVDLELVWRSAIEYLDCGWLRIDARNIS